MARRAGIGFGSDAFPEGICLPVRLLNAGRGLVRLISRRRRQGGERGAVLLVVLAALAFIVPLIYAGLEQQRFHTQRVDGEISMHKAYRHAQSMVLQARKVLELDGVAGTIDHLQEIWAQPLPLHGLEEAQVTVLIKDDQRYWNLNLLVKRDGTVDSQVREIFGRIFARQGLREELLDALIDWIDPDDLVAGLGGAENGHYVQAGSGYGAKNAPLESLDELLLVKGWSTRELAAIRPFFTVTGRKLNVNTADAPVLQALAADWSAGQAQAIVEGRRQRPYKRVQDLLELRELQGSSLPRHLLAVSSTTFTAIIFAREGPVTGVLAVGLARGKKLVEVTWQKWNQ